MPVTQLHTVTVYIQTENRFPLSNFFPQAGIASPDDPSQLILALEPEAASFCCRKLPFSMFIHPEKSEIGNTQKNEVVQETLDKERVPYMVVDNGGELFLSH